jgi:hypothetical protein
VTSDKWHATAVPLLEFIGEHEGFGVVSIGELADATGLDPTAIAVELERLIADEFVDGEVKKLMSGGDVRPWRVVSPRLAERGARTVGAWPAEDPYEALLEIIDRKIDAAGDPAERSRWERMRDTIVGLGTDVGSNVVASALVELLKVGL